MAGLAEPTAARSAAAQVWPPFVLVAGLLLVGMVADADGLFAAAGRLLADLAPGDGSLFVGCCLTVAAVTAVLNLDTAVVFLTPVLVHAARRRGSPDGPLVIACILVANAASLLLPGSNLTNLLVLGHLRLTGGEFVARTALPWGLSVLVTGLVVAVGAACPGPTIGWAVPASVGRVPRAPAAAGRPGPGGRGGLGRPGARAPGPGPARGRGRGGGRRGPGPVGWTVRPGHGRVARRPAAGGPLRHRRGARDPGPDVVGPRRRSWPGSTPWAPPPCAAAASVLVNNLPAASLLAARTPPHPFALLVGLDIGPNLFVTGSLAWVLWMRAVRTSGVRPPTARAVGLGLVSAPLAMAAALGALAVTGAH